MQSKTSEEHSQRVFWVIQTIFGYIIGRSFHTYAGVFIPPFESDITTLSIALVAVYTFILWSWIDFSYSLIVAPYRFNDFYERSRFICDLLIVLNYTYLLAFLDHIKDNPGSYIIAFFIGTSIVFVGYLFSGLLRIKQYGSRASNVGLIVIFLILFSLYNIVYWFFYSSENGLIINRIFITATLILIVSYRMIRSRIRKRKHNIAVDVDGVLANQIEGVLPIIKAELNVNLKYTDINSWDLKISNTSIDKVIVNEQQHKSYVVGMPMHQGSLEALNKLIKRHYISIATARPRESDGWTKEWLEKNKIPYDSFFNLKEGLKHNEDFDILVDDYIGNIRSYLEKHHGKAILFSQPWNQDRSSIQAYIDNGRLRVVSKWEDIPEAVKNLLA